MWQWKTAWSAYHCRHPLVHWCIYRLWPSETSPAEEQEKQPQKKNKKHKASSLHFWCWVQPPPPPPHTQSFSKLDLQNWPNTVQCTDSFDHPSTQRFNPSFSHGRRRQASQPFLPNINKVQATHQAYGWLQSLQNDLWEFPLLGILAQQKNGENKKEEETKRTWQWSRVEIWLKKLLLHVLHVHVSLGLIEIFWTSRGTALTCM